MDFHVIIYSILLMINPFDNNTLHQNALPTHVLYHNNVPRKLTMWKIPGLTLTPVLHFILTMVLKNTKTNTQCNVDYTRSALYIVHTQI